jgi:hypothetical protein
MSDTADHEIEIPNEAQAPVITPSSTFIDESYTYAQRDRELSLMENLLVSQLESIRMERALLRHTLSGSGARTPTQNQG